MRKTRPVLDRIMEKVRKDENINCWIFQGAKNKQGYGRIYFEGGMRSTHRVMFEQTHNIKIPKGLEVHHLCFRRNCCQIDHLTLTSHKRNVLLQEKYVAQRTERLGNLLEESMELDLLGVARFDATELKRILGCRRDNGNNVQKLLNTIQDIHPGRFRYRAVERSRQRGKPWIYELRICESLREEILAEETVSEVEAIPSAAVA